VGTENGFGNENDGVDAVKLNDASNANENGSWNVFDAETE
jgi:hypothetical protein